MKPTPLVAALALLYSSGAFAQTATTPPSTAAAETVNAGPGDNAETGSGATSTGQGNVVELEKVVINASADASSAGLAPAYPGGQVARGSRVGILGTQGIMETPFSTTAYTNQLIRDKQAGSVGDVLQNDPGVSIARGFGNIQEPYFIRGFILGSDDISYNGLYSILPRQFIAASLFERVEVLRGATAFLSGATPGGGGIGGAISLLPKRATNSPITRLSAGTGTNGFGDVAVDIGRRFGAEKQFGVRVNGEHRGGGTAIDDENAKVDVASLGADLKTRRLRLSFDIGVQRNDLDGTRPNVSLGAVSAVPSPPDASINYAQPWTYSNERDAFGTARGELDILPTALTLYAAYGHRSSKEANSLANPTVTNASTGGGNVYRFDNTREDRIDTGSAGFRGEFSTGPIGHEWVADASWFRQETDNAYVFYNFFAPRPTSIYAPVDYQQSDFTTVSFAGNNLDDPTLNTRTTLRSYALGDTLSAFNKRVLLTLGARHQEYDVKDFPYNNGAIPPTYKRNRTSPSAGLVVRPVKWLSVYGNYIEGLTQNVQVPNVLFINGAPVVPDNRGEFLDPFVSKQIEAGLKLDTGRLGAGVAVFRTRRPRNVFAGGRFDTSGEDRHQGVEANMYGVAAKGLRLLGGFTVLEAEQQQTGSAATDGKRVIGVPRLYGSFSADYDLPWAPDVSTELRLVQFGPSYADSINTLKDGGWTRFDIGARYRMDIDQHEVTLRARINNLFDRNYWASVGGFPESGYLVAGAPRSFLLNAQFDY